MKFPEQFRWQPPGRAAYHTKEGDQFGFFLFRAGNRLLKVMVDNGDESGWEHASISIHPNSDKLPTWTEMCEVKRMFWEDSECVVQYHPPQENYVNFHNGVLHLWRSKTQEFPMPPTICV